jgi:tetratricopeptide (TPR) repeat protein
MATVNRRRRRIARPAGRLAVLLGVALAGGPAAAQAPDPFSLDATRTKQYANCMAMARKTPKRAHDEALAWREAGGGNAALHCIAVALLQMGYHDQAARQMEELAGAVDETRPALRAALLGQAANAWLIAGNPAAAEAALDRALELDPHAVNLRIDRGIARASRGQVWEALDDLNRALELDPDRVDALVFRAAAWRRADSLELAAQDANRALALAPDDLDALLERGAIREALGDKTAARADWLRVIELAAEGPLREAARRNLETMDVKPD